MNAQFVAALRAERGRLVKQRDDLSVRIAMLDQLTEGQADLNGAVERAVASVRTKRDEVRAARRVYTRNRRSGGPHRKGEPVPDSVPVELRSEWKRAFRTARQLWSDMLAIQKEEGPARMELGFDEEDMARLMARDGKPCPVNASATPTAAPNRGLFTRISKGHYLARG